MSFLCSIYEFLFGWWSYIIGYFILISLVIYLIPIIITKVFPVRNLGKKYDTQWALVTGASSGIGKALSFELASEKHNNLNLVLVALDDSMLENTHKELCAKYPKQKFIKVGVDLSKPGYIETIAAATKDIDVSLIFSNAGFLRFGPFESLPIEAHVGHVECNVMTHLKLTHHFYSLWKQQGTNKKRAIAYTASSVGYFPAPYSTLYGGTKSFVINWVNSFSVEAAHNNVDVLCFNPQYTRTNLYHSTPKLVFLKIFDIFGSTPEHVAQTIIQSVGYGLRIRDQGAYSILIRMFSGMMFDSNLLLMAIAFFLKLFPDYEKMKMATKKA